MSMLAAREFFVFSVALRALRRITQPRLRLVACSTFFRAESGSYSSTSGI